MPLGEMESRFKKKRWNIKKMFLRTMLLRRLNVFVAVSMVISNNI